MNQNILLCIVIFLLTANLGLVSWLILRKKSKPTELVQPKLIDADVLEKTSQTLLPKQVITGPTSELTPFVMKAVKKVETKFTSTDVVRGDVNATKEHIHDWELTANSSGHGFDIHVEWSDNSSDILAGKGRCAYKFKRKHGVVPVKVVGIPPCYDNGVDYIWSLNGFHWS